MCSTNRSRCHPTNLIMMFILFCGGVLLSSCNEEALGFALPEGDIGEGKAVYKKLDCNTCHSIAGIDWSSGSHDLEIHLGGALTTKKTYGELVTSIINPSHKIAWGYREEGTNQEGLSRMVNYNAVMTVQELIDLVSFLQSEYEIVPPATDYYPYY